jgi:hypothetical protein
MTTTEGCTVEYSSCVEGNASVTSDQQSLKYVVWPGLNGHL